MFLIDEDNLIANAKRRIGTKFKMKGLWMMHYVLGMEMWKSADGIFLSQGKYIMDILKIFRMMDYKVISTTMASNLKLLCYASLE